MDATGLLVAMAPVRHPAAQPRCLDWRALVFTAVARRSSPSLIFGVVPAWQVGRTRPNDVLQGLDRCRGTGFLRWRKRPDGDRGRALDVLLVGAGLMIRSLLRLNARRRWDSIPHPCAGGRTSRCPKRAIDRPLTRLRVLRGLEARLAPIPGVQSVAFANRLAATRRLEQAAC